VIANIGGFLGKCRQDIKERQVKHFYKVDPAYGEAIAKAVGVSVEVAKM
jgi:catalase